jgi:type I restriction enzyme S subunit
MKVRTKFKETEIGTIPEDWKIVTLSDLTFKITKGTTPTTVGGRFVEKGINFVKVESLNDDGTISKEKLAYIHDETNELLARSKLELNDLLYSIAGTIGRVAIVNEDILPANTNQAVAIVRPNLKKINLHYLRYALVNPKVKSYLLSKVVHAVQANLSLTEIGNCSIPIPNSEEQQSIAKILSDLDSKIELNQQMNKTLERIGQALFKQWFIDFEFPNEKGEPYKSSGGKMVDSEMGEIPKGWQIKEINDCGKVVCGKTPPTQNKENYGDEVPFITIPDMRGNVFVVKTEKQLSKLGAETQAKKELPSLAVCVSCIATPGLVSLTSMRSYTNQQINSIIRSADISPYFMFYTMREKSEDIQTMGLGGTATLNLNTGDFSRIKLVIPDQGTMIKFHNLLEPVFNGIKNNMKEVLTLSDLRDSLLPRLMSGKIRVNVEASS